MIQYVDMNHQSVFVVVVFALKKKQQGWNYILQKKNHKLFLPSRNVYWFITKESTRIEN